MIKPGACLHRPRDLHRFLASPPGTVLAVLRPSCLNHTHRTPAVQQSLQV